MIRPNQVDINQMTNKLKVLNIDVVQNCGYGTFRLKFNLITYPNGNAFQWTYDYPAIIADLVLIADGYAPIGVLNH